MTGLTSPTHIVLLLLIALLLFGAKRLPEIGRSLGSGMREFKDSITGKTRDDDDDDDSRESGGDSETRRQANAALGRPDEETAPVDGEVVSERTRS